jgi:ankyrin repeat protein
VLIQLLRAGADVNAADEHGFTALMDAAIRDQAELVKILLQHGADPDRVNQDGRSARELAEQERCFEAAKVLATMQRV